MLITVSDDNRTRLLINGGANRHRRRRTEYKNNPASKKNTRQKSRWHHAVGVAVVGAATTLRSNATTTNNSINRGLGALLPGVSSTYCTFDGGADMDTIASTATAKGSHKEDRKGKKQKEILRSTWINQGTNKWKREKRGRWMGNGKRIKRGDTFFRREPAYGRSYNQLDILVVLTLTRIIKSVVTGQAPVTLKLRNTPGNKTQTKGGTRIYHNRRNSCLHQKH